jgi:hypothetical protein
MNLTDSIRSLGRLIHKGSNKNTLYFHEVSINFYAFFEVFYKFM